MWSLIVAGCASAPPPPEQLEGRAWGGGDGLTVTLAGDAVGTVVVPGASAASLAAYAKAPPRDPCPGDAVRWRRTEVGAERDGPPSVAACALDPEVTFRGRSVGELSVDLGEGEIWVDLWLDDGDHVRAEAPFDRKVSLVGTQQSNADWRCRRCEDASVEKVGDGTIDLRWGFDRAVERTWTWSRGG